MLKEIKLYSDARYLPNHKNKKIKLDVKNFIQLQDYRLQELAATLRTKSEKDTVLRILNYVVDEYDYVSDETNQNYTDFWQFPFETYALKCGDCEDLTFLFVSLARLADLEQNKIFACIGGLFNDDGFSGHSFGLYVPEGIDKARWPNQESYIVECTGDEKVEKLAQFQALKSQYAISYIFNDVYCYKAGAPDYYTWCKFWDSEYVDVAGEYIG